MIYIIIKTFYRKKCRTFFHLHIPVFTFYIDTDDIIIYIDTSGSMDSNANSINTFCTQVLNALTINELGTRVALITYGNNDFVTTHWDLESPKSYDLSAILSGIYGLEYDGSGSDVWLGFSEAYRMLTAVDR